MLLTKTYKLSQFHLFQIVIEPSVSLKDAFDSFTHSCLLNPFFLIMCWIMTDDFKKNKLLKWSIYCETNSDFGGPNRRWIDNIRQR